MFTEHNKVTKNFLKAYLNEQGVKRGLDILTQKQKLSLKKTGYCLELP